MLMAIMQTVSADTDTVPQPPEMFVDWGRGRALFPFGQEASKVPNQMSLKSCSDLLPHHNFKQAVQHYK